jgi:hypothetical protein
LINLFCPKLLGVSGQSAKVNIGLQLFGQKEGLSLFHRESPPPFNWEQHVYDFPSKCRKDNLLLVCNSFVGIKWVILSQTAVTIEVLHMLHCQYKNYPQEQTNHSTSGYPTYNPMLVLAMYGT